MQVIEIREKSLLVLTTSNERLPVAKYTDSKGTYVFNEDLKKEYLITKDGFVIDSTYLGS